MKRLTKKIIFSDVTARDGLQSLQKVFSITQRSNLIKSISNCGFTEIEVGSLVNPKVMPQMGKSINVYKQTLSPSQFKSFVLAGNEKSIKEINENNIKYFSLFTSPSDTFNKKNINTDVDGSFERFKNMLDLLDDRKQHHIKGYISCIGDCPFEGDMSVSRILYTIKQFNKLGVDEICIADTIGTLKPGKLQELLNLSSKIYDHSKLSLHLHTENELTTYVWKENLIVSINNNVLKFDTSLLGLGGCPAVYSQGRKKTGNLNILYAAKFLKEEGYDIGDYIGSDEWVYNIKLIEDKWKPLIKCIVF
jgi:hydroxymethylglutaryl-CoA lyase